MNVFHLRLRTAGGQGDEVQERDSRGRWPTSPRHQHEGAVRAWVALLGVASESRGHSHDLPPHDDFKPIFHLLPVWNSVFEELCEACS